MNKRQMSGASIISRTAGMCFDNKGRTHLSIHPSGRRSRDQSAQRKRREQRRMAEQGQQRK